MKYGDFEIMEYTAYSRELPHHITICVSFKSKTEREKFKRKIKEILNE